MDETDKYMRTMHNVAVACVVACPLIMLLPPRKLGFSTILLGGMTVYSTNYLVFERTGRSLWQTVTLDSRKPAGTPQIWGVRYDETRQKRPSAILSGSEGVDAKFEALKHAEDWKSRRDEEVKEALDDGKGIGDMIYDQIWEVINWGKKTDDDEH